VVSPFIYITSKSLGRIALARFYIAYKVSYAVYTVGPYPNLYTVMF